MKCFSLSIFFVLTFCFLLSCNKQKEFLPIPADAELIVKINGDGLSQKILLDKIGDLSIADLFKSTEEDTTQKSPGELLFADPGNAGIDYTSDFFLHKKQGVFFLTVHLDDYEELKNFLEEEIRTKVVDENHIFFSSCKDFTVGFTKKFAVFYPPNTSDLDIHEILNLPKEKSVFATTYFADSLKADISFTASTKTLLKKYFSISDTSQNKILSERIFGSINFEEGKIRIEANHLFKPFIENSLLDIDNKKTSEITTKEYSLLAALKINPEVIHQLFPDSTKHVKSIGTLEPQIYSELTGEVFLNIDKFIDTVKTFSTYKLDEDFNTITTTDTLKFLYPSFNIDIPLKGDSILLKLLVSNHIIGQNESSFDHNSTFNFTFGEIPIYFKIRPTNLSISSEKTFLQSLPKISSDLNIKASGLYIQVNPGNLHNSNQTSFSQLKNITVWGEKKSSGYILQSEIHFSDESQNGLLSLIKFIKDHQSPSQLPIRF